MSQIIHKCSAEFVIFNSLGMTVKVLCEKWLGAETVFLKKCRESLELMLDSKADENHFENEAAERFFELTFYC